LTDRLVVFIDYQNVYNVARESFHKRSDPASAGQCSPVKLGELIASRGISARDLVEVRVYRGRPDSLKDPKTYGAHMRQCDAQIRAGGGKVTVVARALRYPHDWPQTRAQEKGIDVALAVDFVQMAVLREFDVGVIVSTDTDMKPAIEAVLRLPVAARPKCEVAAWENPGGYARRISVSAAKIWCHWLSESDYLAVADPTDYNVP